MSNKPEEIKVYICPACGDWQRWAGSCNNRCQKDGIPAKSKPVVYKLAVKN